jgi:hypothetical protein
MTEAQKLIEARAQSIVAQFKKQQAMNIPAIVIDNHEALTTYKFDNLQDLVAYLDEHRNTLAFTIYNPVE